MPPSPTSPVLKGSQKKARGVSTAGDIVQVGVEGWVEPAPMLFETRQDQRATGGLVAGSMGR